MNSRRLLITAASYSTCLWARWRICNLAGPMYCPATRLKLRTAYQDFFNVWKDADLDIPILKEAKAEYAKLQ